MALSLCNNNEESKTTIRHWAKMRDDERLCGLFMCIKIFSFTSCVLRTVQYLISKKEADTAFLPTNKITFWQKPSFPAGSAFCLVKECCNFSVFGMAWHTYYKIRFYIFATLTGDGLSIKYSLSMKWDHIFLECEGLRNNVRK